MIPVIGGASDGDKVPMKVPRLDLDGEVYMLVSYRDGDGEHYFYQLSGLAPADVVKIFKERHGKKGS